MHKFLTVLLSLLPFCLLAQGKPSPLEETLKRANILYHAGAYRQSRLLYENAVHQVDRDANRDILTYNIGSSFLAEGEPQMALDLWNSTTWAPSPPPWLTRRLSWNSAVAQIQKAAQIDSTQLEGQLESLRLLHAAQNMLHITEKAECLWHQALSPTPCLPTLKLQEAREWTQRRLFALQSTFQTGWMINASPIDLVGSILAIMQRFEEGALGKDCTQAIDQMMPYWEEIETLPSLKNALHLGWTDYQVACRLPFDAKTLRTAREFFGQLAERFNYPFYLHKTSQAIRLGYAQGLAQNGDLLHALNAAKQHRSLLKGSQEGGWAARCALLGEEAFMRAQFDAARLLWQLTCFWLDEQAVLLDHVPNLDETAERLLTRHLWTEFFLTHLLFFPPGELGDQPALKEALSQLVESTLGTATSLFSLAQETQLQAFEDNECSSIAWDQALPLISHGETFMRTAFTLLQSTPPISLRQPALINNIQHAYPFWAEGVNALHQHARQQHQEVQTTPTLEAPLSPQTTLSLQQRTLLLQEMDAQDHPLTPRIPPSPKEARPW